MPRHHLVPQMLLRRFANEQDHVRLCPRTGGKPVLTAVRKACSEVGFYEIPTEDVVAEFQEEHDPELVEKILSDIEGEASRIIDAVVAGDFPLDAQRRFKLALFLGLQMSRGWAFRESMNQIAQNILQLAASTRFPDIPPSEFPKVVASKTFAIQHGLSVGVDVLTKFIYLRTWRLLQFDAPCLLTSDSPFGYWAPPELEKFGPFGVGNAPLVFFPLDRKTALAMSQSEGRERTVRSGATRARQINYSVGVEAERWIVHHPSDSPLDGVALPDRGTFVHEYVGERATEQGEIRQLFRIIKR